MANKSVTRDFAVTRRREQVAELRASGLPLREIASQLGVSTTTIFKDCKAVADEWASSAAEHIGRQKFEQLARLEYIEREALLAWERSKAPQETETIEEPASGAISKKNTTKGQTGNPKYLQTVRDCIETRAKILGLLVHKIAPTDPSGNEAYHDHVLRNLTDDQLRTLEAISVQASQQEAN